ncbi:MAG: MFS transporter [Thainema sp.]
MSSADSSKSSRVFTRRNLPLLLVLMSAGALTSVVGGVVAPVFPEVVEQFNIDPQWAGVMVGMHTLTIALASPICGILADRIGKFKVLIPSLLLYSIFGMMGAFAQSFAFMMVSRALVGVAAGGIAAGGIGFLASMFDGDARSRAMGYATSALASSSIFFPLLGGWLGSYNWRYAFGLYVMAIPIMLLAIFVLRKPVTQSASTVDLSHKDELLRVLVKPGVLLAFLALAMASAVFYIVIVYAPLYYKQTIDASTLLNGAILASRAIGASVISAVGASRIARRLGINGAIMVGFLGMAMALATVPYLDQPGSILLAALGFGLGFGVVMPNLYDILAKFAPEGQRAGVLAIGTGASSLGQFLSPLLLGPVWKYYGIAVFFVGSAVAIAVGFICLTRHASHAGTS